MWRCRTLYNVAREQRKLGWERGQGVGASYYQQQADLPDLPDLPGRNAACPERSEIHAHVLQEGMGRLDRAFQGNGAVLDGGVLSLSTIGRLAVRWRSCPDCGTRRHRDHNAALNRERAGQALQGGVALAAAENREAPGFSQGEHVTKGKAL